MIDMLSSDIRYGCTLDYEYFILVINLNQEAYKIVIVDHSLENPLYIDYYYGWSSYDALYQGFAWYIDMCAKYDRQRLESIQYPCE